MTRPSLSKAASPGQTGHAACDPKVGLIFVPTEEALLAMGRPVGKVAWRRDTIKRVNPPALASVVVRYGSDTNLSAVSQKRASVVPLPVGCGRGRLDRSSVNGGTVILSGAGGDRGLLVLQLPQRAVSLRERRW